MQIENVDVLRLRAFRRQTARIDAGTSVMEFVAASVRKREHRRLPPFCEHLLPLKVDS